MKIFRDAFAIALMDEAQIEPDEVVKQANDQQNDKKSNQQENVKGSDIKNEMPPPTLISADQGTKKNFKEDKGTKKND